MPRYRVAADGARRFYSEAIEQDRLAMFFRTAHGLAVMSPASMMTAVSPMGPSRRPAGMVFSFRPWPVRSLSNVGSRYCQT